MSTAFPEGSGPARPLAVQTGDAVQRRRRIDRLGPLLHELVALDVVHEPRPGVFELRDDVQQRLAAIAALRGDVVTQVYVGRSCILCHHLAVTRLVDGEHVCAACTAAVPVRHPDAAAQDPSGRRPARQRRPRRST